MTFKRQEQRELPYRLVLGNFLSPIDDQRFDWLPGGAMLLRPATGTDKQWVISKLGRQTDILRQIDPKWQLTVLDYSQHLLIPSFVDLHFHWVQDDVRQMPKENLLDWLKDYTWPAEEKFKNKSYARQKALHFTQQLAQSGTLGGGCYGSCHGHTVDLALQNFIGDFIVGNVLMTMNSPDYLLQKPSAAVELVRKKTERFKQQYAVTPRFAPTTHPEVMSKVSSFARKSGSFIQSHLAETQQEIDYVLEIFHKFADFKKVKSYTEIYQKCGLLGPKTIMGHGIYLTDKEWSMLAKTKTALAHCPTSNAPLRLKGLGSGLFDYQLASRKGVRWALASDIGGGPYLSMLDVMQMFIHLNKKNPPSYTQALYRATLAGEKILQKDKVQGNFKKNKWANMLALPMAKNWSKLGPQVIFKKMLSSLKRDEIGDLIQATIYRGQEIFLK